jgi:hypothetical protein
VDSRADLWTEVLKCYLKFGRLHWICSQGSFRYKGKTELVQISIWIYAVGGRADALPSAPGGSAF